MGNLRQKYTNEEWNEMVDSTKPGFVEKRIEQSIQEAAEKYDEWNATLMDGIEYESWDELYDDYVGEADLYEFVQWLKDNFQVPNKL